jgi:hypothetical protein
MLQSDDLASNRARASGENTRADAGDLKKASRPWIARRSKASDEVLRWPGRGARRGRARGRERGNGGHREVRNLTLTLMESMTMAREARRRLIDGRPVAVG